MTRILFLKASKIPEGARWITVHPNGPGTEGQPVLIQENPDGSAHVIGGAGGKLNYLKLRRVRKESEYKKEAEERRRAKAEERKAQRERDKEAGVLESKRKAQEDLRIKQRQHEREFIETVARTMGWEPTQLNFPEHEYTHLSDAARAKLAQKHHRDLLRRAHEAVELQRQQLVTDHAARMEAGIGEVPLEAKDPETISVQDLAPLPETTGGLGFAADYKGRAEKAGLTEEELKAEAEKAKQAKREQMTDAQRKAAIQRGETAQMIKQELANVRAPAVPDAAKTLADAKKAVDLLKAHKKLKQIQRQVREASAEIQRSAAEPKAYVIEYTASPDEDEKIAEDLSNDLRTMQTRAFLAEYRKLAGPNPEETLGKHIGVGAYNSINSLALAVGGDALVDRSVVDVLGIAGAAQVLARRIHSDLPPEDVERIADGVQEFHLQHYMDTSAEALAQARELIAAAKEVELGEAANGADLQVAQELNARRRKAIGDAQKILGQSLGEMEANAALVVALKQGKKDSFQVSLGKTGVEQAIQQARALGLQRGDYTIEHVAGDAFLTVNAAGLDRLAKPIAREDVEQIKRNLAIINGAHDEDGWLPLGIAKRPDLAMDVKPGVAPRLAEPFQPGDDLEQSLRDYIGGRAADGDAPADIVADIQSADFFQKVGWDRAEEYRKALDAVAPLRAQTIDHEAAGPHIRYHVTAAADAIMREGFKPITTGGVGIGGGSTTGHTFTFADRDQARRLRENMQKMEAIRTAPDPIAEASRQTGRTPEKIRELARQYFGDGETDEKKIALYGAGIPYIPATSFMHDGPKRDFKILPVDVSGGQRVGGEKDGEERWEPHTVKVATKAGKQQRAEALASRFEQYADDFVARRYGGDRAPIHRQNFKVDEKAVDALHRALAETPEGTAAWKQIGELTPQDQRALREFFYRHVAKESPEAGQMRAELERHEQTEPERETTDMFGETTVNPEWTEWKQHRDALAAKVNSSALTWGKYVESMRGHEKAYEAVQDLIRSRIAKSFVEHHNRLKPDAPLKLGKTVIRNNLNHLDATDPAAREARQRRERELIDSLRERVQGRYAAGGVADKLDAAREQREALEQAQMGFFSTEQADMFGGGGGDAPKEIELAGDERHTLGHIAERQIAGMMGVVGRNFKPGQPVRLWEPSMSGGKNAARQRLVKMVDANKRVVAAFGTGSGKTLLQMAAFTHAHAQGKAKRALFLVPSIVQGQFSGEALRYLEPGKYNWHIEPGASREERIAAYKNPDHHFCVMTHQSFRDDMIHLGAKHAGVSEKEMADRLGAMSDDERKAWMGDLLKREGIQFDFLSTDESQYTLNRAGKENSGLANVVDALSHHTPYYLMASGDPVKNDASEVFDLLRKMDPGRYTDRAAFMRRYGADTLAARDALKREMARYVYPSRIDPDVRADRQESVVPLSEGQKQALADLDRHFANARLARMQGKVDVAAMKAISPVSFDGVPEDQHEAIAKDLQQNLGILKSSAVHRVIHTHPDNPLLDDVAKKAAERKGKPGVVFAHNIESVKMIAARLQREGHRVVVITGADSAKEKERKRLMFRPEQGEAQADILVASDAGATGMNIQRGQWLYQFDTPMTAMTHAQRNGRIFRTGQKNDVELIDGVADHPEVHKARERLRRKYGLREIMTSPMEGLDDTGVAHYLKRREVAKADSQNALF